MCKLKIKDLDLGTCRGNKRPSDNVECATVDGRWKIGAVVKIGALLGWATASTTPLVSIQTLDNYLPTY